MVASVSCLSARRRWNQLAAHRPTRCELHETDAELILGRTWFREEKQIVETAWRDEQAQFCPAKSKLAHFNEFSSQMNEKLSIRGNQWKMWSKTVQRFDILHQLVWNRWYKWLGVKKRRESKNRESTKYHEEWERGKESDRNARKILALLGETKYGISRYQ